MVGETGARAIIERRRAARNRAGSAKFSNAPPRGHGGLYVPSTADRARARATRSTAGNVQTKSRVEPSMSVNKNVTVAQRLTPRK